MRKAAVVSGGETYTGWEFDHKGIVMVVHKLPYPNNAYTLYQCTEVQTGRFISKGQQKRGDCIQKAKDSIDHVGVERTLALIAKHLEETP